MLGLTGDLISNVRAFGEGLADGRYFASFILIRSLFAASPAFAYSYF